MFQSLKGISGYYNFIGLTWIKASWTNRFNPWKGLVVIITFGGWNNLIIRCSFNPWKGLVVIITMMNDALKACGMLFQSLKGISGYYNSVAVPIAILGEWFQSLKGISGYYNLKYFGVESWESSFNPWKGLVVIITSHS